MLPANMADTNWSFHHLRWILITFYYNMHWYRKLEVDYSQERNFNCHFGTDQNETAVWVLVNHLLMETPFDSGMKFFWKLITVGKTRSKITVYFESEIAIVLFKKNNKNAGFNCYRPRQTCKENTKRLLFWVSEKCKICIRCRKVDIKAEEIANFKIN